MTGDGAPRANNRKKSGKCFLQIITGMILLANPCVNVIDIFPDFIGMALILHGMKKISETDTHAGRAREYMIRACWVSLGKLIVMLMSFRGGLFDSYMLLVFTLVGGLLDCVFFIPAMRELTAGTEYTRLAITGESNEAGSDELNVITAVFFVAKGLLTMAPMIPFLFADETGMIKTGEKKFISPESLVPTVTAIAAALALIIGAVWIAFVLKYFVPMKRDEKLCCGIDERYASIILADKYIMRKKHVSAFFAVLVPSTFLLLCFSLDIYYVSFAALFGVAVIVSSVLAKDLINNRTKLMVLSAFSTVAGAAAFILMINYSDKFGGMIFAYSENGFIGAFLPFIVLEMSTAVLILMVFGQLRRAQENICENCVGRDDDTPRRAEISEAIKREINKKIKTTYIWGVIYCSVSVICASAIPFQNLSDFIALSWVLRSAAAIGYIISTASLSAKLKEEAEK